MHSFTNSHNCFKCDLFNVGKWQVLCVIQNDIAGLAASCFTCSYLRPINPSTTILGQGNIMTSNKNEFDFIEKPLADIQYYLKSHYRPKISVYSKPSKVRSNLGRNLLIKSLKGLSEQSFLSLAKALDSDKIYWPFLYLKSKTKSRLHTLTHIPSTLTHSIWLHISSIYWNRTQLVMWPFLDLYCVKQTGSFLHFHL